MKKRIVTGVIAGALFLAILWLGGMAFALLISFLALVGWSEYAKMLKLQTHRPMTWVGFLFIGLIFLPILYPNLSNTQPSYYYFRILLFLAITLFVYVVGSKNRFTIEQAGAVILGLIYIGFGFCFFLSARIDYGMDFIVYILIVIWSTDSGAYFVGKKFGKRKLWPSISPNKTIEGSMGAVLVALVAAFLFQAVYPHLFELQKLIMLTVLISIVGQLGDLIESAMKRHYNVKDSGTILPGHGGVLDRFDSLLFVFPVLYLLQLI